MLSKLRDIVKSISRSSIIDEAKVKEIIKEIQRTLIMSDVSPKLVAELSKEIEKEMKSDKRKLVGVSEKERLIKTVYDRLVEILGGKETYEPRLEKHKILMVGLYGQGKCVKGDTLVPLPTGEVLPISIIYGKAAEKGSVEKVRDGTRIIKPKIEVYSLNQEKFKIDTREIEAVWRLKKPECLYEITAEGGKEQSITVTAEHPFFTLEEGELKEIRADELSPGTRIAIPSRTEYRSERKIDLWPLIYGKCHDLQLYEKGIGGKVRKGLLKRYGSIQNACEKLDINYCRFLGKIKEDWIPIDLIRKMNLEVRPRENLALKLRGATYKINFPRYLHNELAEFLGYLYGDGHITKRCVEVFTGDSKIRDRFEKLSKKMGLQTSVIKDRRANVERISCASTTLSYIIRRIFGFRIGRKGRRLQLTQNILRSPVAVTSKFLRAYFDCDGHVFKRQRIIKASSESGILLRQIQALLLRHEIVSFLGKKTVRNKKYYNLRISARNAERFARRIGSILERKKQRLREFRGYGNFQGDGKLDMIPTGNLLKKLRQSRGLSIGEMQKKVNSYGKYEKNKKISISGLRKVLSFEGRSWKKILKFVRKERTYKQINEYFKLSRGRLNSILMRLLQQGFIQERINPCKRYKLTGRGEEILDMDERESLEKLKRLESADVRWIRVEGVRKVRPREEYVYDLTVHGDHNFIANGFVVHNTTTIGKVAKYYSKKGLKTGVICCDVDRPAAYEQIKQLAEKVPVPYYGDPKEKKAEKILKTGLKELKELDIVVVDSAGRNALNKDLARELKEIHEALKPREVFLVIGADLGNAASKQALAFREVIPITGVIITRMDSSGKAGGALSACASIKVPVTFIGVGEKLGDLETFEAEGFVSRLLGFGDISGLLKKVREVIDEEEFSPEKLMTEEFNLRMFYQQMKAMKKMGPLQKVMEMMGLVNIPKEMIETSEEKLKIYQYIMDSMTKEELDNPELAKILDNSRIKRIAKGSGTKEKDVKELLKQYKMSKKMLKKLKGGKLPKKFRALGLAKLPKELK